MGQLFTEVRPGDLITANLMNQVLHELEELQVRVAALETGNVNVGAVVITDVQPSHNVRIGDRITVVGANFAVPASLNIVAIGSTRVTTFALGSTDTQLVFDVPTIPAVGGSGTPLSLTVTNTSGSASTPVTVRPALIVAHGRVEIDYDTPPVITDPNNPNIVAGDWVFGFSVIANTDSQVTYSLNAMAGSWQAVLLEDVGDQVRASPTLTIPAGTDVTRALRVRVTIPAGGVASNTLRLEAFDPSAGTGVTPGSEEVIVTRDQPPPTQESRVRVSLRLANPPAALVGHGLTYQRNVGLADVEFSLRFTVGGTFTVTAAMRTATGWTFGGIDVPQFNVQAPQAGQTTNQVITVQFGAGAGAGNTDLVLAVTGAPDIAATYSVPVSVV